jgi:hypothetical protein
MGLTTEVGFSSGMQGRALSVTVSYENLFNFRGVCMSQQSATEVAILGGGCFWCLQTTY